MPSAAQRRPNLSLLLPVCKESLWRGLGYILLRDGYPSLERRTFLVSHCSLSIAIISMNSIFHANPGTRVPRFPVCGCKGTTKNQYQPNISTTFFQENFAKITKTSHISNLPPQNFYAVKHIFPPILPQPTLKSLFTHLPAKLQEHIEHYSIKNKNRVFSLFCTLLPKNYVTLSHQSVANTFPTLFLM